MQNTFGLYNPNYLIDRQGLKYYRSAYYNLNENELVEAAVERSEGTEGLGGSLLVTTGEFTGRSPNDKYIVVSKSNESEIWWDNNSRMNVGSFVQLQTDMLNFVSNKELFIQDLYGGAEQEHRINVRLISELAWHNLFLRHLLIKPTKADLKIFSSDFTIINIPSFRANPEKHGCRSETVIAINLEAKLVLIAGTEYGGENKKAVFTILNYLLPKKGILPMHCAANRVSDQFSETAIFFGLSGTGKTTLSTDGKRVLIGDDEHGWSDKGIFNFEGGCYAKTIDLTEENEPVIYKAIKHGSVIENVFLVNNEPDYSNTSLSENGRCCYPRSHIENAVESNSAGEPKTVIFLTCDLTGVIPPVSILSKESAAYHFLSGYTAKVGSTEMGSGSDIASTFSTCFGAPFFPRPANIYADLLMKRVNEFGSKVFLVNTGWTGGPYGVGSRFKIPITRRIVNAIQDGELDNVETMKIPGLNLDVPVKVDGVDTDLLNPVNTWEDKEEYQKYLNDLINKFQQNFKKFNVNPEIVSAGPGFNE